MTLFDSKTNMAETKKKKVAKKKSMARATKPKVVRAAKKRVAKSSPRKLLKKVVAKKRSKKIIRAKEAPAKTRTAINLERHPGNPIINPTPDAPWASKATFNPTAFYHDGKIHIVYRAVGEDDNSVLGYAVSDDGFSITEQHPIPVYHHYIKQNKKLLPIAYSSGGGWGGGSEDPRLVLLDDHLYLFYTAFDGWGSVRMALSSIELKKFLAKDFDWEPPVLISPPGQIHKNWVLFPEKINGKYAILHSLSPEIMIDYFDSMDNFDGDTFIYSVHQGSPLWGARDRHIRGVGPAPIKTKYGWLILYHAMQPHDPNRYKLFAMITDLKDPTKVLYRSPEPILEPDEWYENEGFKWGVVYSCGAVVKDGVLLVYYGGADKVSCVATADLDAFLKELITDKTPKMQKTKITKK